jgi:hypothetical protein
VERERDRLLLMLLDRVALRLLVYERDLDLDEERWLIDDDAGGDRVPERDRLE